MKNQFYKDFSSHCLMRKKEKRKMKEDFEKAFLYYEKCGVPIEKAMELLDVKYLGGFYARPAVLWFPLDNAAKIYPISMEHGRMHVFRLSVNLKEAVVPELLQMALHFTIKRFPSFSTTLKKGFFWHYLDTSKRRFRVEPECDIPCQPLQVSQSGSQTFRVLYYQNRISVEFFHVLTDGTGGMTFLKVLVSEYLRLTGVEVCPDETLWDINATPQVEEFENAFLKVPKEDSPAGFVDKTAVQLTGKLSKSRPCRVIQFKMDVAELKRAAGKYHATITAYMLAIMFLAARAAMDELQGELSFQVPVDMRKYYPSKTVRNFTMYCGIRLPAEQITDIGSIVDSIKEQMETKTSKRSMSQMMKSTEMLVKMLKYIPLCVKQPVAKSVCGFLGDKIFTSTFSNLGVVKLPEAVAQQIDSMDFILGTSISNRAGCSMVTINDVACFSIAKMTIDPSFEEKMYDLLCKEGIPVLVEGSELYER